jgi:NitT/TauT family transport system permease protein
MITPLFVFGLAYLVVQLYPATNSGEVVTLPTIIAACAATLTRLMIAYALSAVFAIPLALLVERNRTFEAILLPIFDVFESIPNLAILPVLIIFFLYVHFLEGAAITILFLTMVWSIVFALIGGLQVIPKDVTYAAHVFGLRGSAYVRRVVIPAVFPQFVTGSILAVASGWNIIIVAEALHAYAPSGSSATDLFGVGSVLVHASANSQNSTYLSAFFAMVVVIALFNFFVWQKLLHYSQRFRFE